ncbi:CRISPR-associated protein [Romeria aff. gracilis LEGE 07310]|uniref:CRISPR-associated protein n=1 Tax=Vasconcelosia minhoensis LEGE 07310 TaxID=915328 RepID=A0A8J7AV29_9CYAN|nr:RAMP superfamily CRISPR-associated protein [Romeria gracilis]MBE9077433.1 CRISPR-associated protein [Romeria aff. gracilis LEGE 07310]
MEPKKPKQKPKPPVKKSKPKLVENSASEDSTSENSKPYNFVSLSNNGKDIGKVAGHDKFDKKSVNGKLFLTLNVQTSTFVSTGLTVLSSDISDKNFDEVSLIKTSIQKGNKLVIPGSSLKGTIRSAYEAVTRSCLCKTKAYRDQTPRNYSECKIKDNKKSVCPACQVFGAMGWQGLISFSDAVGHEDSNAIKFIPMLYQPDPECENYYQQNGNIKGRKFYYHAKEVTRTGGKGVEAQVAAKKYVLKATLQFRNISQAQLGTLLIVLGQDSKLFAQNPDFHDQNPKPCIALKVGGGKPIGLGSMTAEVEALEQPESLKERYSRYDIADSSRLTGDSLRDVMSVAIAAAYKDATHKSLVEKTQLEALADILKWPTMRTAPEDNY